MATRKIIHVDLDAFFAAVEILDNPELTGKPVIVGGIGERGVVSTASYAARKFGVHSAQPMARAQKLCSQGIFLPVRMHRYKEISENVFEILYSYTPIVEPLSIDEAFLDVTGSEKIFGGAENVAGEIKRRIQNEIGLSCSVGIAPNKFLAKIASDIQKPDGFVVVQEEGKGDFLANLLVGTIWGIGKMTEKKLNDMGVYTISDLRMLSLPRLKYMLGNSGEKIYNLCRGIDEDPVVIARETKSISSELTFPHDLADRKLIQKILYELSYNVAEKLKGENLWARSVQLKVRFSDFATITRSKTYAEVTNLAQLIWQRASEIFDSKVDISKKRVRLVGVAAFNLAHKKQMYLFPEAEEKMEKLEEATGKIRARFGKQAIKKGW